MFPDYVTIGNFDIAQFTWGGSAFPLASLTQIYAAQGRSNYGKIGSPEINTKVGDAVRAGPRQKTGPPNLKS